MEGKDVVHDDNSGKVNDEPTVLEQQQHIFLNPPLLITTQTHAPLKYKAMQEGKFFHYILPSKEERKGKHTYPQRRLTLELRLPPSKWATGRFFIPDPKLKCFSCSRKLNKAPWPVVVERNRSAQELSVRYAVCNRACGKRLTVVRNDMHHHKILPLLTCTDIQVYGRRNLVPPAPEPFIMKRFSIDQKGLSDEAYGALLEKGYEPERDLNRFAFSLEPVQGVVQQIPGDKWVKDFPKESISETYCPTLCYHDHEPIGFLKPFLIPDTERCFEEAGHLSKTRPRGPLRNVRFCTPHCAVAFASKSRLFDSNMDTIKRYIESLAIRQYGYDCVVVPNPPRFMLDTYSVGTGSLNIRDFRLAGPMGLAYMLTRPPFYMPDMGMWRYDRPIDSTSQNTENMDDDLDAQVALKKQEEEQEKEMMMETTDVGTKTLGRYLKPISESLG